VKSAARRRRLSDPYFRPVAVADDRFLDVPTFNTALLPEPVVPPEALASGGVAPGAP